MMNCNIPTYYSVLLLSKLDNFGQEILLVCALPFFQCFSGMHNTQKGRARDKPEDNSLGCTVQWVTFLVIPRDTQDRTLKA